MFKNNKNNKGFTIIELLVVIAIIAVLAAIVLANINQFRVKAKIAAAKADIRQIIIAMEFYRAKNGELPPIGDSCSACYNPCDAGSWNSVVDALINDGDGNAGMRVDPWNRPYCYDDNDKVCCGTCTPLYSMGPNGISDSPIGSGPCSSGIIGDDIGQLLPYSGP